MSRDARKDRSADGLKVGVIAKLFTAITLSLALVSAGVASEPDETVLAESAMPVEEGYNGWRDQLELRGIQLEAFYSGFWQGLDNESTTEHDFQWGNRCGAEGQRAGSLWPVNSAMWLPIGADEKFVASSLYLRQQLGERTTVAIGKFNVIDFLADDPHFGGWGVYRFMNLSAMAPASGLFPPVIIGGQATYRSGNNQWSLFVYDPADRSTDYFTADDLFDNGVNFNLGYTRSGTWFGRTTQVSLNGIYSTKIGTDLRDVALPPGVPPAKLEGSWAYSLQLAHQLVSSTVQADAGLWLYAKVLNGDGNPNYVDGYVSGGISGRGLIPGRPDDTFGFSYFDFDFSDVLLDTVAPDINLDDESGVELYYMLTTWEFLKLGLNVQWIDPGHGDSQDFMAVTLRTVIEF